MLRCEGLDRLHCPQVPPQAGPDVRKGYLQRFAGFVDQLLGRVARAFNPKTEQTGDPLLSSGSTLKLCHRADGRHIHTVMSLVFQCYLLMGWCFPLAGGGTPAHIPDLPLVRAAAEVAEDVKGPVVLATASGQGPAEVTAYRAEQSRVVEGVSADRYLVEPSLVADDVPLQAAVPHQALTPVTANAHNNAAAVPAPAPEPDQESAQLFIATAPGPAATAPAAAISPGKGNANAHNNSV